MCGIGGFCDLTQDNRQWKWEKTGERMCRTLERQGPGRRGDLGRGGLRAGPPPPGGYRPGER